MRVRIDGDVPQITIKGARSGMSATSTNTSVHGDAEELWLGRRDPTEVRHIVPFAE